MGVDVVPVDLDYTDMRQSIAPFLISTYIHIYINTYLWREDGAVDKYIYTLIQLLRLLANLLGFVKLLNFSTFVGCNAPSVSLHGVLLVA